MRMLVSCVPYDGGKSGISVYVREVVRNLAAQGHELVLVVEPGNLGPRAEAQKNLGLQAEAQNTGGAGARVTAPRWARRPALSMLWHLLALPFWIWRHRREFDGFFICSANRRVCAFYPLPTAATVHDLANFHVPGKYSRARMFYLAHILPHFAKKARHLVAVSGATKADMVKFWHCPPEQVTVLYNGLGNNLGPRAEAQNTGGGVLHPGLPDGVAQACAKGRPDRAVNPALLYISRIEHPGKNHVRLIEAYGRLPREVAEAHPLVLAGADWQDAETVHAAAKASPHADLIRFTGFVPEGDMERLWASAGFYVFPSLFEGFGLSLAEAMARGIPCACSNNGSLGEIAGDVAITFDPENVDEIAGALARLVGEPQADREARVARGREWVKKFSWSDHAAGIARLLSEERRTR